jgi:hypothetical protein
MKIRLGSQEGSTRPNTTKKMDQVRMKSQTAHKDIIEGKKTAGSRGDSAKHFRPHNRYGHPTHLLFQNSWIPNSYRVSRAANNKTEDQINSKETDDKSNKADIKKIIPMKRPPPGNIIITNQKE